MPQKLRMFVRSMAFIIVGMLSIHAAEKYDKDTAKEIVNLKMKALQDVSSLTPEEQGKYQSIMEKFAEDKAQKKGEEDALQALKNAEEKAQVTKFCHRYNLTDPDFINLVFNSVKGKVDDLNSYGVPNLCFQTAYLLYGVRREEDNFGLLYDVFTQMPKEQRRAAYDFINAVVSYWTSQKLLLLQPELMNMAS